MEHRSYRSYDALNVDNLILEFAMKRCSCGSGLEREAQFDGYGIFLTFTCEKCYKDKMSKFRSDIFERYPAQEPIEPED